MVAIPLTRPAVHHDSTPVLTAGRFLVNLAVALLAVITLGANADY